MSRKNFSFRIDPRDFAEWIALDDAEAGKRFRRLFAELITGRPTTPEAVLLETEKQIGEAANRLRTSKAREARLKLRAERLRKEK